MADTLVEFTADVNLHCKGDVLLLNSDEKKAVDEYVDAHDIKDAYKVVETPTEASKAVDEKPKADKKK